MINGDQGLTKLAEANPVPDLEHVGVDVEASAYLATISQRSSEMTKLETKQDPKPRLLKRGLIPGLVAVAAAVLVVALAFLYDGNETPPPATDPAPPTTMVEDSTPLTGPEALDPQLQDALSVASSYMAAVGSNDIVGVEQNAVDGHVSGFVAQSLSLMDTEFAWLEAVGWSFTIDECALSNPDLANTRIRCTVSHRNAWSEALGVGPFFGAYNMRVQYEGDVKLGVPFENTAVSEMLVPEFGHTQFNNEVWTPFEDWLRANHPDDFETMLVEAGDPQFKLLGDFNPILTQESIELWRQHTSEFVAAQS